jgi:SAM-dependent methyltransferase
MTDLHADPRGLRNRQDAQDYDRFSAQVLGPWDRLFLDRCVALCPTLAGLFVDVGAGTGVVLQGLAERPAFAEWDLLGLELFDDMVAAGNARLKAQGVPARMAQGDAQDLPLDTGSVAMVVSRATIHHLPDKVAALREMYRVLRPGGIGLIHDARRDMPADLFTRFNAMRAAVGYLPTTLAEKLTAAEMAEVIAATGLGDACRLFAGSEGLAALGFEVVMRKPE